MKKNNRLQERRKKISKDLERFVEQSFDIVDRIHFILKEKGMEQKDLAKALGKTESEISKWMTGTHNFTIKTVSRIEAVLEESVLQTVKECSGESETRKYEISSDGFEFQLSKSKSLIPKHFQFQISSDCEPQYYA